MMSLFGKYVYVYVYVYVGHVEPLMLIKISIVTLFDSAVMVLHC